MRPSSSAEQIDKLRAAYEAARKVGRELLIEIIAGKHGALDDDTIARALTEIYDAGHQAGLVEAGAAGQRCGLGGDRRGDRGARSAIAAAWCCWGSKRRMRCWKPALPPRATSRTVKGFAVGRTIFAEAAKALAGGHDRAMTRRSPTWRSGSARWSRSGSGLGETGGLSGHRLPLRPHRRASCTLARIGRQT